MRILEILRFAKLWRNNLHVFTAEVYKYHMLKQIINCIKVVNNIDQKLYRNTDYKGWWNTYEIKNHFGKLFKLIIFRWNPLDVLFYLMDNKLMPGTRKELYKLTKMDKSSLHDEILWVQKLVQVS